MYDLSTKEGMQNAVEWTERLFANVREGGVWYVPRSMTAVTIYPSRKAVDICEGPMPDRSIAQVVKAMGWEVNYI